MYFYEVLVSSQAFHGKEPLTYSAESQLAIGSVVQVSLRNKPVAATVVKQVSKPKFVTKPITKVILQACIPNQTIELISWLGEYYPAPLGILAQLILPSSLVRKRDLPAASSHTANKLKGLPDLSNEQMSALKTIQSSTQNTFLLHGDTGTGKTRLYIELAQQTLVSGRSVLVLTPEIGLTPQLEARFKESLAHPVITIHSNLTPADRRNVWQQIIQAQEPIVVMGPRSALFSPIHKLGLIVVDEAHDQAYKQESAPYYQALRVASKLSQLHNARIVFGTATPLITEYYLAEAKHVPILRLTDQPAGKASREVTLVNMRDRDQFPTQPHLSLPLMTALRTALDNKQQSLVFLNRRGTARLVLCQVCGWTALCPHCDLPLTYHGDSHTVQCHTCGYKEHTPTSCPECKSTDIIFRSIGTKSIVEELQKEFPSARIQRFDTDNIKSERLENHFNDVHSGNVDILVGTQMLAKGLDLPKLSVVGVVAADTSLYFPDYTAEERTYQLLTQVIGRVGRGHQKGHVIIQTYNPESPAIHAAIHQNWSEFYQSQIKERKTYGFPPFYYYLKLSCARASIRSAQQAAETLADNLTTSGLKIALVGPSPAFHEKLHGKYHWQLLVKARDRKELLKVLPLLPANWTHNLDPANLL